MKKYNLEYQVISGLMPWQFHDVKNDLHIPSIPRKIRNVGESEIYRELTNKTE